MRKYYKEMLICLSLAAAVFVIYAQVRHFGLAGYDDYAIMDYAASHVRPVPKLLGAFTGGPDCYPYRVPLTMLSHMVDCMVFGENYGRHHLVNVFLHTINVLLLFYVFRISTGVTGRSACLAALFAVHPLNVEAVAWLPSRVTQLSAVFFLLTIVLYFRYAARPTGARYAGMSFCYVAGLMAKPEIAYLPLALLLMDFWPLGRWHPFRTFVGGMIAGGDSSGHSVYVRRPVVFLMMEKLPLLLVATAGVILTILFYRSAPFYGTPEPLAFVKDYLPHAPLVYWNYFIKILLPLDLSFFKPLTLQDAVPIWKVAGSSLFLVFMTVWMIRMGRSRPYLAFGWLWFLGTVTLPVALNIFRHETMAYRYAYLPGIGILVILVWGGYDIVKKGRFHKAFLVPALCLLFAVSIVLSWRQAGYWQNIVTLYENSLDAGQYPAEQVYYNLGDMMLREAKSDQAILYYRKALELEPDNAHIHQSLGLAYSQSGDASQAVASFQKALEIKPEFVLARNNLANLLADLGRIDEAVGHYRIALETDPSQPEIYNNLATALVQKGEIRQAVDLLKKALTINPQYQTARDNLNRLSPMEGQSR